MHSDTKEKKNNKILLHPSKKKENFNSLVNI